MDRLDLIELLEALNSQLVDLNNTVRDQGEIPRRMLNSRLTPREVLW
jgi:hypothetical protein